MTPDSPRVSVIIPAYNQSQYLAQAIRSVLAQTYSDYEIVVVDDGSTDDTPRLAQQFCDKIRYIRQDNQGLAGARNTGIREARGEYVALLDSDDSWLPTFLESMMELAAEEPGAAVYYCSVLYVDANGQVLPQRGHVRVIPPQKMYDYMLRTNPIVPSATVMRRSVVAAEGSFDIAFRRLQDRELWIRLLRKGHIFVALDECLVNYRLHDSALSTNTSEGQQAARALVEKHFGLDDGQWHTWPADKRRAYGGFYRYCAVYSSLVREGDWQPCAEHLSKALRADPTLAADVDLFYELARGTQPMGQRGTTHQLDLADNATHILSILETVFDSASGIESLRRQAYGTAHFSLGLVAYNTGQRALSRGYLLRALYYRPDLCTDNRLTGNLVKSFVSQHALQKMKGCANRVRCAF